MSRSSVAAVIILFLASFAHMACASEDHFSIMQAGEKGFFNIFKGAEFGTRARVEVTNTGTLPKIPGFAVAVMDKDGRLLGAASGGTKFGTVKPGETETFDLNYTQVKERLGAGDTFFFAIELRN